MTPTLTLYTREGCCLCEDAHAALERVRADIPFRLEIVDLDREASQEKLRAYGHEVPVVELDGRKVAKYSVDEERLARLLRAREP